MKNVGINLMIDRHRTSGNARIHGKVGKKSMDVVVQKGPTEGDFYLNGSIDQKPTTLRINSAFAEEGHAVFGRMAGVPFRGNWQQKGPDGDATLMLDGARLEIDVDQQGGLVSATAPNLRGTGESTSPDGDEQFKLRGQGEFSDVKVDRQENGDILMRGKSSDGPFRLKMDRRGLDGDLRVTGTIPESLSLMPMMWELYGNDNLEPVQQPLGMGAAASLSTFWNERI